jgi:FtsH-binding integral membrane protein
MMKRAYFLYERFYKFGCNLGYNDKDKFVRRWKGLYFVDNIFMIPICSIVLLMMKNSILSWQLAILIVVFSSAFVHYFNSKLFKQ